MESIMKTSSVRIVDDDLSSSPLNISNNSNDNNTNITPPSSTATTTTIIDSNKQPVSTQQSQQQQQQSLPSLPPATPTTAAAVTATVETPARSTTIDMATYVNIYNHAIYCTQAACPVARCTQLRRLITHSRTCQKIRANECDYCRQLIALTVVHAKTCGDAACAAPYCASVKQRLDEINEMRARVESAYEFVSRAIRAIMSSSSSSRPRVHRLHDTSQPELVDSGEKQEEDQKCTTEEKLRLDKHRQEVLSEIERVKKTVETAAAVITTATQNLKKVDLKFGKELGKFVFKKLLCDENRHGLDKSECFKSVQFARLARTFLTLNLGLLKRVAAATNSTTTTTSLLDDYLYLLVDLAHRFDVTLSRYANKRSVECQTTDLASEGGSGVVVGGEKRAATNDDGGDNDGNENSKRMRFM